jgi:alcohol dehydrogenase
LGIVKHPGAFAGFLTLPDANLHLLPRGIDDVQAVFIEPVAAACEILDQVKVRKAMPTAVLGDGKLGLLVAQVLHLRGAAVTLFGRHKAKLEIASKAGIETHHAEKKRLKRFDLVVDATGSAAGLEAAVAMVHPRGTVVMKSTIHQPVALQAAPVIVNEVTLIGSRCGRFEPAIRILPRLRLRDMLADTFPLEEAEKAFSRAAERGSLKVLLRPGPETA